MLDKFSSNCSLIAVREVAAASELEILTAFRANNYVDNQGMYHRDWTKAAEDCGVKIRRLKRDERCTTTEFGYRVRCTVAEFLKMYPTGVYFVSIAQHAFVIREGAIVDPNMGGSMRSIVHNACLVLNPKPVAPTKFVKFAKFPGYWKPSKTWQRRWAAYEYLNSGEPKSAEDCIRDTAWTKADYRWELKRGALTLY